MSALVAAGLLAGCEDPQAQQPGPAGVAAAPATLVHSGPSGFRVVRDGAAIAEAGDRATDAEWTADSGRVVVATGTGLRSIDVLTGAATEVECGCTDIAVVAGKVFAVEGYGADRLSVFDAATLSPADPLRPGLGGLLRVDGAGDRLVVFPITADGARPVTDVVVLDPATGHTTRMGSTADTGAPTAAAYTPRGWDGRPAFAYTTNGSSGAAEGTDSVVWFDPTGTGPLVVTDDQPLRERSPDVAGGQWNSGRDNPWWAADGTLHATAWTWTCASSGPLTQPTCTERVPHTQWRYDGRAWSQTDERALGTVRDFAGATLELALPRGSTTTAGELALVRDGTRTVLAAEVERLWTAPGGAPGLPPVPDVVARYAPLVWLAEDERNLPGSAEDFLRASKLIWANDGCADDVLAERGQIDTGRLTTPDGYTHHTTVLAPGQPAPSLKCVDTSTRWNTVQETRPRGGKLPGGQGFALEADNGTHGGMPLADGRSTAPVYFQYQERRYIYYWFFYPYNDAPGLVLRLYTVPVPVILPTVSRDGAGLDHEGDWERISLRLDPRTNAPLSVDYAGHGHASTLPWDQATVDGRPAVYSALGTHASYPTGGRHPLEHVKYKGIQLPVWDTTGQGARWQTWDHLVAAEKQSWWCYAGGWGEVGLTKEQTGPAGPNPHRKLDEGPGTPPCD